MTPTPWSCPHRTDRWYHTRTLLAWFDDPHYNPLVYPASLPPVVFEPLLHLDDPRNTNLISR